MSFFSRNNIITSKTTGEIYRCVASTREAATFIGDDSGRLIVPYPLNGNFFKKFRLHESESDAKVSVLKMKRGTNQ